jgi:predicted NBD/HSP70 family sugar kinase
MTHPLTEDVQLRRVMHAIWVKDGIPRVELAQLLDLDKSTITKIVTQLLEAGIVVPGAAGEAKSVGGRKPIELRVAPGFGRFLGLEIQTEKYLACVINPLGGIEAEFSVDISFKDRSLRSVMLDAIMDAMGRLAGSSVPLLGIGVGLSGLVDADRGILRRSYPLGIPKPEHLVSAASGLLSLPLRIDNDARCCCWSELVRNRGTICDDFMFILGEFRKETAEELGSGLGVGMGIVIDGKVHDGSDGSAGEFRSVFKSGPTRSQFSLPDGIVSQAAEGEAAFRQVADELGRNVSLLVNILNLRHIVIGGGFVRYRELFSSILPAMIEENTPYPGLTRPEIRFSPLGESVVAFGAASMLLARLFAEPPSERKGGR